MNRLKFLDYVMLFSIELYLLFIIVIVIVIVNSDNEVADKSSGHLNHGLVYEKDVHLNYSLDYEHFETDIYIVDGYPLKCFRLHNSTLSCDWSTYNE